MRSNRNEKKMKMDLQVKTLLHAHRPAVIANAKRATLSRLMKSMNKYADTYGNIHDGDGKRVKIS